MSHEPRGAKTKKVYDAVKRAKRPISIKEIVERTNVNPNTVRGAVQRLLKRGLIKRFDRGIYEAIEKG
ncbi:MAG: winged helix-turn-helix transcriptional regulator [Thermofilum sp.]